MGHAAAFAGAESAVIVPYRAILAMEFNILWGLYGVKLYAQIREVVGEWEVMTILPKMHGHFAGQKRLLRHQRRK